MKRFALLMLFVLGVAAIHGAEPVTKPFRLRWDDPNPAGLVAGYRIYRQDGTNWVRLGDSTTNEWTIGLPPGAHRLAVTAWTSSGGLESQLSQPLDIAVLVAVVNLHVSQP